MNKLNKLNKQTCALTLALLASLATPAFASVPVTEAAVTTQTVLDPAIISNRLATARLWADMTDAAQRTRQEVSVSDWGTALVKVRVTRAQVEKMQADKAVAREARLLLAELRPSLVDLESRVIRRNGASLRYADLVLKRIDRMQTELIAQGLMDKGVGGGAGVAVPQQPEVLIIPHGQPVPPGATVLTPEKAAPTLVAPGN